MKAQAEEWIVHLGGFEYLPERPKKAAAMARRALARTPDKDIWIERDGEPPRGLILGDRAAWRLVPRSMWIEP